MLHLEPPRATSSHLERKPACRCRLVSANVRSQDDMVDPLTFPVPESIETSRLVLRCFRVTDAQELHEALVESLAELRANLWFLPWVAEEQSLQSAEIRCRKAQAGFLLRACRSSASNSSPTSATPAREPLQDVAASGWRAPCTAPCSPRMGRFATPASMPECGWRCDPSAKLGALLPRSIKGRLAENAVT